MTFYFFYFCKSRFNSWVGRVLLCTSISANENPWLQGTKWLKQQGVQEGIGKVMKQEERCLCKR